MSNYSTILTLILVFSVFPVIGQETFPGNSTFDFKDSYSGIVFGIGVRPNKLLETEFVLNYTDESGNPTNFFEERTYKEKEQSVTTSFTFEYGGYNTFHFEIGGNWAFGHFRPNSWTVGGGYNFPFRDNQIILRPVAQIGWGAVKAKIGEMEFEQDDDFIRVGDKDFFSDVDLNFRQRSIEFRPRVDLIYRLNHSVFVRGHVGYVMSSLTGAPQIEFRGTDGDDSRVKEQLELTDPEIDSYSIGGVERGDFFDLSNNGLFYELAIGFSLGN